MNYRRLGTSGLKVSELSFGSWITYGNQMGDDLARDCMAAAYAAGVNFFDNAEVYAKGQSETIMGNVLKKQGVKKGDRVTIYMPMVPELPIAMLACARIGAIHSIVFGGFSAESLRNRIQDCASEIVITADGGYRAGRLIPLKQTTDAAISGIPFLL